MNKIKDLINSKCIENHQILKKFIDNLMRQCKEKENKIKLLNLNNLICQKLKNVVQKVQLIIKIIHLQIMNLLNQY